MKSQRIRGTLESRIVVLVGIFVKINKCTGWNKHTGWNNHQIKYTKSKTYFQVSYSNFYTAITFIFQLKL